MALSRPRALVLRALGIGDLLTAVPALRGLRRALPDHEIVLAAPAGLRPLVGLVGAVDALLAVGELEPVPWQGRPPDVAVDMHGRGPRSHRLLQALSPGRVVGFGCTAAGVAGLSYDEDEHEVRRWARLVAETFDVGVDSRDLRIAAPAVPSPAPGAVVVHAGAKAGSRRWPADRFAQVARWCRDQGERVVLTGSSGETGLAHRVRRLAGLPSDAVLAGSTPLADLAALISAARLVVCGDTGVAHLATAYATPSVVLFGPMPPTRWGPPEDARHVVMWRPTELKDDRPGDPLGDVLDPALDRIGVAEVLAGAASQLRSSSPATREPRANEPRAAGKQAPSRG